MTDIGRQIVWFHYRKIGDTKNATKIKFYHQHFENVTNYEFPISRTDTSKITVTK